MTDVRVDQYNDEDRVSKKQEDEWAKERQEEREQALIELRKIKRKQQENKQAEVKPTDSTATSKSKEDKEENDTDTSGLSSKEVDAKSKKMRDAVARNSLLLNNDDFKAGLNDLIIDGTISQMDVDVLNYLLNDSSEFDEEQIEKINNYIKEEAEKDPTNTINISSDILTRINDKIKESEEFNSNHKEFASNLDKIQENLKVINDLSRELGEQNRIDVDPEKVDEVAEKTKKELTGGFALKDGIPPQMALAFLTPALIPMGGVVVSAAMLVVIMKILPKFTKVRKIGYMMEDGISKAEGNEKKSISIGLNDEEEHSKNNKEKETPNAGSGGAPNSISAGSSGISGSIPAGSGSITSTDSKSFGEREEDSGSKKREKRETINVGDRKEQQEQTKTKGFFGKRSENKGTDTKELQNSQSSTSKKTDTTAKTQQNSTSVGVRKELSEQMNNQYNNIGDTIITPNLGLNNQQQTQNTSLENSTKELESKSKSKTETLSASSPAAVASFGGH